MANPLQYSFLENPMDRRAWWAAVHGVAQPQGCTEDTSFLPALGRGKLLRHKSRLGGQLCPVTLGAGWGDYLPNLPGDEGRASSHPHPDCPWAKRPFTMKGAS